MVIASAAAPFLNRASMKTKRRIYLFFLVLCFINHMRFLASSSPVGQEVGRTPHAKKNTLFATIIETTPVRNHQMSYDVVKRLSPCILAVFCGHFPFSIAFRCAPGGFYFQFLLYCIESVALG